MYTILLLLKSGVVVLKLISKTATSRVVSEFSINLTTSVLSLGMVANVLKVHHSVEKKIKLWMSPHNDCIQVRRAHFTLLARPIYPGWNFLFNSNCSTSAK